MLSILFMKMPGGITTKPTCHLSVPFPGNTLTYNSVVSPLIFSEKSWIQYVLIAGVITYYLVAPSKRHCNLMNENVPFPYVS